MTMIWLLCFANLLFGFIFAYKSHKITYLEFAIVSAIVWLLMLIVFGVYWTVRTTDIKFVNDKIISLRYEGPWVQSYTCCKSWGQCCSGTGKNRSCYACCKSYGTCYRNIGDSSDYTLTKHGTYSVSNQKRKELQEKYFNGPTKVRGSRPNYVKGDEYDYIWTIKPNVIAPWTGRRPFKNYIAPSENIIKGNANIGKTVEKHPANISMLDNFKFNKVVGLDINQEAFAILNSSLKTDANLILYGFEGGNLSDCENLKAHWVGGKVNDLVCCVIHNKTKITAVKVFGWTENEIVKKELEGIILNINISEFFNYKEAIIEAIDTNYVENDMKKYSYLTVKVRKKDYWLFFVFFFAFSIVGWLVAYKNDIED